MEGEGGLGVRTTGEKNRLDLRGDLSLSSWVIKLGGPYGGTTNPSGHPVAEVQSLPRPKQIFNDSCGCHGNPVSSGPGIASVAPSLLAGTEQRPARVVRPNFSEVGQTAAGSCVDELVDCRSAEGSMPPSRVSREDPQRNRSSEFPKAGPDQRADRTYRSRSAGAIAGG